jgi:hypothetical protein
MRNLNQVPTERGETPAVSPFIVAKAGQLSLMPSIFEPATPEPSLAAEPEAEPPTEQIV